MKTKENEVKETKMKQTKNNKEEKESEVRKAVGRIVAGAYYDMQQVRIATKNRIRGIIRAKAEGIPLDRTEKKKDEKDKTREKKYTDEKLFGLWNKLLQDKKIIEGEHEYVLETWKLADSSESIEGKYKTNMSKYIVTEPIYRVFLEHIRGIGEVLSANLIKEFGYCERYDTVSKLWAHTGNSVINGKSPKLRRGEQAGFSSKLRTLTWKISDCLMKSNNGLYRRMYDDERKRLQKVRYDKGELFEKYKTPNKEPYKRNDIKLSEGHMHNMALRKMRKMFLEHYWVCSREITGQSISKPWQFSKPEHTHYISWRDAIKAERTKPKNPI